MLSYQHAYHAGNHADILKHYVLLFVLNSLNKKEKPYTFYDTHSGSGLYDLFDNRSLKTGEAENGIKKIFNLNNVPLPDAFNLYKNSIYPFIDKNLYPGSPFLERLMMRTDDILILSELHPQEIEVLKENINSKKYLDNVFTNGQLPTIQIHDRNGWEMIKALTPPKTKRGGVLIDPSYETTDDYENAAETIIAVNKKWSNGIVLLWYPLLAHRENEINTMLNKIQSKVLINNQNTEILNLQFTVNNKNSHKEMTLEEMQFKENKNNPPRLYGSGMLVINAPWKLEEEYQKVKVYLEKTISFSQ